MTTLELPAGVQEAARLTAGLDRVVMQGFSRFDPKDPGLVELGDALAVSPLGTSFRDAVAALGRGELLAHHLATLAAARAGVEGARFDALAQVAAAALGVELVDVDEGPASPPDPAARALLDGAQQWLLEIALSGLGQLELAAVAPAVAGLRNLQEHPQLGRVAALLTGFVHELLDAVPTSGIAEPPTRRWVDLWSRALLSTVVLPGVPAERRVSGTFTPLGADLRHHEHLLACVVHGLLQVGGDDAPHLVRTTISAWRVDAIAGEEVWALLRATAPELIDALGKPRTFALDGAMLRATGDLVWPAKVAVGKGASPTTTSLAGARWTKPAPRDRHPLQLAIPLVGDRGRLDALASAGAALDMSGVSPYAALTEADVRAADGVVGLLRFDDGFFVQPLAATKGKSLLGPAGPIAASAKINKPVLGVLRERASKLLRA